MGVLTDNKGEAAGQSSQTHAIQDSGYAIFYITSSTSGTQTLTASAQGVDATATLHNEEYGTEVKLVIDGLNDGEWYWLWLTGSDGNRVSAGTLPAPTPSAGLPVE